MLYIVRVMSRTRGVLWGLVGWGVVMVGLMSPLASCSRDDGLECMDRTEGNKRVVGTLKDGKRHGRWTTWSDGEMFQIEHYRDGKLHGPHRSWLDPVGPMTADGTYFADIPHGRTRVFYAPGRLSVLGWYSHGRRERTWCAWEPDGSLEYIRTYQQNKLIREQLSPPGQCPLIFGDGKRHLDPENADFF